MTEVLAKRVVLPPCGRRPSGLRRRPVSVAALPSGGGSSLVWGTLRASSKRSSFYGKRFALDLRRAKSSRATCGLILVQMALSVGKSLKWWEKGLQPNMKEIESAQDLVDSLLNAGDKLVIVDFFSPGCAGCRALHPKICQLAEMNPDVLFLQVNYEKHKSMSYSLNVHVLPFFRFYRGAHGRLCSFSCTNATIKKFKDALAKHNTDRCSLGPAKGLEEKELLALAANKDLSFTYTKKPTPPVPALKAAAEKAPTAEPLLPIYTAPAAIQESEEKSLAAAGRRS